MRASAAARLTVTVDFPTPPLPLPTARAAAADGQQGIDFDPAVADDDVFDHVELDDAAVELGVLDVLQGLEHLLARDAGTAAEHWGSPPTVSSIMLAQPNRGHPPGRRPALGGL